MSLVPKHIKKLKPYVAGKSKDEFRRKYGDINPIKLASNENSLGCSPKSIERVQEYLESCNRYPDSSGYKLREKLAKKHDLSINNVIIGSGSEGIMSNIMRTFLHGNDKIISSRNSFIGFRVLADASGYDSAWVPMDKYHYDLDAIARMIDPQTKIIYLANPDNPTGTFFNRNQFDKFMQKVPDRILIILDEAYYEFAKQSCTHLVVSHKNLVVTRTFSKAFGLASVRLGYCMAHPDTLSDIRKIRNGKAVNALGQLCGIAALDDLDYLQSRIDEMNDAKKFFIDNLPNYYHAIDSDANFVLVKTPDSKKVLDKMKENKILIRDRSAFDNLENCVRITIGSKKQIIRVLDVMTN